MFKSNDSITRAEFAALLNCVFIRSMLSAKVNMTPNGFVIRKKEKPPLIAIASLYFDYS